MSAPPALDDVLAAARVVDLPLRTRFRGVEHREALLVRGPAGWGEFAPFPEYGPAESARWLAAALEAAWTGWPPPRRTSVPVNATVPAVPAAQVPAVLARYDGCTTAKVKVAEAGQHLGDDVARVRAVREVLGPAGRIRVDANAAWSVDDAARALAALAPVGLEYAEQPCATLEELAALRLRLARAGLDVPLAADESIRRAEDPLRVVAAGAADVVVLKVAPLAGVRPALAVAAACGLPVVVSSALDTSVGIAAGVALAAALPELPFACGLGTVALLAADVVAEPRVPVAGELAVGPVEPTGELLAGHAAAPERVRWWRERVAACWEHLPHG
ncbi:o-succinylbenzoate synthase [Kineococcus glutinatus]|uniref:o-succinylbenzoate synthase n=1 Tax=Kineococcus glutinatus TaxID=1070872 RepID=A0ABP8VBX7_9ACTN